MPNKPLPINRMTLDEMDKDLKAFTDFDSLSNRVGYWSRRFSLVNPTQDQSDHFDSIVSRHSQRVLSTMRAG